MEGKKKKEKDRQTDRHHRTTNKRGVVALSLSLSLGLSPCRPLTFQRLARTCHWAKRRATEIFHSVTHGMTLVRGFSFSFSDLIQIQVQAELQSTLLEFAHHTPSLTGNTHPETCCRHNKPPHRCHFPIMHFFQLLTVFLLSLSHLQERMSKKKRKKKREGERQQTQNVSFLWIMGFQNHLLNNSSPCLLWDV